MSVVRTDAARRWGLVAAIVALLVALPALVGALPVARGRDDPRTLLARALVPRPYVGLAEVRGSLGLPDLPRLGDTAALLGGTTRLRAWVTSPTRWRVDTLTAGGERGDYATDGGVETWDFESDDLRLVLRQQGLRLPQAADLLPPAVAERVLRGVQRGDRLGRVPSRRVAGRTAEGFSLTPASRATSVGRVNVWLDAGSALPLRIDVIARGHATPSFTSELLEMTPHAPPAAVLAPPAPPGAGRYVDNDPDLLDLAREYSSRDLPARAGGLPRTNDSPDGPVGVYGGGLARVLALPVPAWFAAQALDSVHGTDLKIKGVTSVLVRGPLVSAAVARGDSGDGYLVAGTVTPAVLRTVLTDLVGEGTVQ